MESKNPNTTPNKDNGYALKVWQTVGIIVLIVVAILIIRVAFNVLLMALAGALIAIYFHGFADFIERKSNLNRKPAMMISIITTLVIIGNLVWFIGNKIQTEFDELSYTLPHTISNAKAKLSQTPLGKKIVENTMGDSSKKLLDTATSLFSTSFGVLGNIYIIVFLGVFFTASPNMYKYGLLILIPATKKTLALQIMSRISQALKGWLKGMLLSMVLIFILISAGLMFLGLPITMVLGLITGILEIVPNFGPLIAMVPGVLIALTISTNTAIWVALLYIISQTIVANIVTPLIQKKMINLPPALTLISQLIMGTVSGALGIILAVPLLAIIVILVDELYVKKLD